MILLGEFKKRLGLSAEKLTDEQIKNLMERQERSVDALFDIWLSKRS